ncbi:MAG: hypothetical protein GY913_02170 [Proteobacteria bacterium]|nr:hypothetical protein [Pseudomonadota bacterium]MCP4915705.1 hypothetical protein [Pseudomonadota bacterium]
MLLLLACATEPEPTPPRSDCNPVEDAQCALPFPSSFFLTEADTSTGYRVDFGPSSLPGNIDDVPIQPERFNDLDGFPVLGMMLAHLPDADVGLAIPHTDLDAYLDEDVTTVVIDVDTGDRIPHFVEREVQAPEGEQLLILRPVAPMEHGHRHVVGIRGLGGDAPDGFAHLRDGTGDDPDIERQRDHYEDIVFPALEADGFARDELLLAWDFVTVSEDNLLTIEHVRDEGLEHEPVYTISSVSEGCPRVIDGTFTAPLYLDSWQPGSLLNLDEDGMPFAQGEADVPFQARVPCTLIEDPRAGALVQYGHGVLGDYTEQSSIDGLAEASGWVTFAVGWTGMKSDDIGDITLAVAQDLTRFSIVPDRLHQGHLEFLLAQKLMQGSFLDELTEDGVTLADPDRMYFYGVSQGGILGGAQVAMSPRIQRAGLSVPGMPFTLILARSDNFHPFLKLFEIKYDDWKDISVLIASMQMLWDPVESGGWAHQQDKPVLVQAAIGDAAVTTLSAHVMSRAYDLPLIVPEARSVWGLESLEAPVEGGGLVEFDWGVEEPVEAVPCDTETNTHGGPFYSSRGREQLATFLETGVVEQTCDGACDPD